MCGGGGCATERAGDWAFGDAAAGAAPDADERIGGGDGRADMGMSPSGGAGVLGVSVAAGRKAFHAGPGNRQLTAYEALGAGRRTGSEVQPSPLNDSTSSSQN